MEHQDYLLTFAEVAAAFAGFSAIVTSFVQSRRPVDLKVNHYRTRVMIEYSLCVVVFAFVPYLIYIVIGNLEAAWRLASALLVVFWGTIAVLSATRARTVLGAWGFTVAPGFSYAMLVFTIAGILILIANTFGSSIVEPGAAYLVGLFFPLLQSAFYFLHIVTYSEPFETLE